MINNDQLVYSVGIALLFLLVSFLLGHFVAMCIAKFYDKRNQDIDAFWKLIIGLLLMTSLFAIVKTNGLSILTPLPILLVILVIQKLKGHNSLVKPSNMLGFIALSSLFYLGFYYWVLQSFDPERVKFISGDFNIYFRIAERVSSSGVENSNLDFIFSSEKAAPYHFADIWLYALISPLVQHHPSLVFFVGFSVLTTIFVCGMYTYMFDRFLQFLGGRNYYLYLVLFSGLFTGFAVFFPKFILIADVYTFSVANWGKIIVQSCLFIGLVKLVRQKEYLAFTLLTTIAGLSFINTLPALFTAAFLWLTMEAIQKKILWRKWLQLHLVFVTITVIYIVLLYLVTPYLIGNSSGNNSLPNDAKPDFQLLQSAKLAVSIFVGGWFQLFTLLPYILILLTALILLRMSPRDVFTKLIDGELLFIILIFISGLLCWSVLNSVVADSIQFFSNVLPAVYALFISLLLMFVFYVVRNKILVILTVLVVLIGAVINNTSFFCVNYFDTKEWAKLASFIREDETNCRFVNLQASNYHTTFFSKNTTYYLPLPILSHRWPAYANYSLNAPFIKADDKNVYVWEERKMLATAPFTRYYGEKKDSSGVDDIFFQFIRDKKIAFISVGLDTLLPFGLRPYVTDSVVLEKSGNIVYRFKKDL